MSKVYLEGVWAEDIFKWYYESVISDGGDGTACIVCENHEQAAEWFIKWWKEDILSELEKHNPKFKGREFWHPREEYRGIINFHDNNENFMFSQKPTKGFHGEYDFIILEDCPFGWMNLDKKLEAYKP
jgi:hypothetical protein